MNERIDRVTAWFERHRPARWIVRTLIVLGSVVAFVTCIAFVVTTIVFADKFSSDEATSALHRSEDNTAQQLATDQSTARARIQSCMQTNKLAQQTIAGNIRGEIRHDQAFARAGLYTIPADPRLRSIAIGGLFAFAQEQVGAHPMRDCTANGVDRYLGIRVGTTGCQLDRERGAGCKPSRPAVDTTSVP